jgi:hypothetical protein
MRKATILDELRQIVSQLQQAIDLEIAAEDRLVEREDDRKQRAKHTAACRRAESLEAKLDALGELILTREVRTWSDVVAIAVVANQSAIRDATGRFQGDPAMGALLDAVLAMGRSAPDGSDVLIFEARRKLVGRE